MSKPDSRALRSIPLATRSRSRSEKKMRARSTTDDANENHALTQRVAALERDNEALRERQVIVDDGWLVLWKRVSLLRRDNNALEERLVVVEEGWVAMLKRFMLLDWVLYVLVCGAVILFMRLEKMVGPKVEA